MLQIKRGKTAFVQVDRHEYNGRDQVHIRLWSNYEQIGKYVPTKKGVALNPEDLDALIKELQRIRDEYEAEGALNAA